MRHSTNKQHQHDLLASKLASLFLNKAESQSQNVRDLKQVDNNEKTPAAHNAALNTLLESTLDLDQTSNSSTNLGICFCFIFAKLND